MAYPRLIQNLIEKLTKLPGIGPRSAERIAFWLLNHPREEANAIAKSIVELKDGLMFCRICNNLSDTEVCMICSDTGRDEKTVCVVENPKDVLAIERSGAFKGHYHVLLGVISPADGCGPDDIKIPQLIRRVREQDVQEVVIATDPDNEGEMTALYLIKELKPLGVKISRISVGIPMGGSLEYADMSTLGMSMMTRREVKE
ncbi:MAG TPA: recombination mediator RecR [Candidatus Omnitrophota bacterium]|nr:recombination mediator RecR [Candidatus Omnitrophota bacterium]